VKLEKRMVVGTTAILLLVCGTALALVGKGELQVGATTFAIGIAVAALLFTMGRRVSELEGDLRRAQHEAEVPRLLESIDRRLAALQPRDGEDA
jgi:hypothetical protein